MLFSEEAEMKTPKDTRAGAVDCLRRVVIAFWKNFATTERNHRFMTFGSEFLNLACPFGHLLCREACVVHHSSSRC